MPRPRKEEGPHDTGSMIVAMIATAIAIGIERLGQERET